jgi:hypothetical protein
VLIYTYIYTDLGLFCAIIGLIAFLYTEIKASESSQPTPVSTPTPPPSPPSKVQDVAVTRTVQGSSPALKVSWRKIRGSSITYTVCYSKTSGTQSDPPSNAKCGNSGIIGTATTLGPLSRGTTYYIWVAAVSSGGQGPYSDRRQGITYNGRPFFYRHDLQSEKH